MIDEGHRLKNKESKLHMMLASVRLSEIFREIYFAFVFMKINQIEALFIFKEHCINHYGASLSQNYEASLVQKTL